MDEKKKIKSYQDLVVWQKSIELVKQIYDLTKQFPSEEKYGLKSQLQRAAVSVPANIAEGHGRSHLGDYLRFLSIAKGSLSETETYLILAVKLGLSERAGVKPVWDLSQEVRRMLIRLIRALNLKYKKSLPPSTSNLQPLS